MRCWGRAGAWLAVVNVSSNPSVDVISLAVVALYNGLTDFYEWRLLHPCEAPAY